MHNGRRARKIGTKKYSHRRKITKIARIKLLTTNSPVHHDCNFSLFYGFHSQNNGRNTAKLILPCVCCLKMRGGGTTYKYVVGIETNKKRLLAAWQCNKKHMHRHTHTLTHSLGRSQLRVSWDLALSE